MNFIPKGIIPAMITPLTLDGKINEQTVRKLINYFIDGGVHGVFVVGTTGEFYGLTHEEKRDLIQMTLDETRGRVPVYAGTAAISTEECIQLTQIAEECGVDAVSILTPMFISPSQEELFLHYKTIAQNTKLPVLLYNNVSKTGVTITAATAEKLAGIENIVGIKDSSGDFTLTAEYIRRTRDQEFYVLAGRDTLIHACLCYGGHGAIAACAYLAPKLCAEIYDRYITGDVAGSLEAQFKLAPLRIAFNLGTFPAIIKAGLEMLGIEAGLCKGPITPLKAEEKEQLRQILIQMDLLEA